MAVVTSKLLASAAIMSPPGMPSCMNAHCVSSDRPAFSSTGTEDSSSSSLSAPFCER